MAWRLSARPSRGASISAGAAPRGSCLAGGGPRSRVAALAATALAQRPPGALDRIRPRRPWAVPAAGPCHAPAIEGRRRRWRDRERPHGRGRQGTTIKRDLADQSGRLHRLLPQSFLNYLCDNNIKYRYDTQTPSAQFARGLLWSRRFRSSPRMLVRPCRYGSGSRPASLWSAT